MGLKNNVKLSSTNREFFNQNELPPVEKKQLQHDLRVLISGYGIIGPDDPYYDLFKAAQKGGYTITCEHGMFRSGDMAYTAKFRISRSGGDKGSAASTEVYGSIETAADALAKDAGLESLMPVIIPNLMSEAGDPIVIPSGGRLHQLMMSSHLPRPIAFFRGEDDICFQLPSKGGEFRYFSVPWSGWQQALEERYGEIDSPKS